MPMMVLRIVTPYALVAGNRPEDGGSIFLRHVCTHLQVHRAPQHGRPPWILRAKFLPLLLVLACSLEEGRGFEDPKGVATSLIRCVFPFSLLRLQTALP
jgi:hypothetical protein